MSSQTTSSNRAAALQAFGIDPAKREPEFDGLVTEALRVTGAPVALLGFCGDDREWVKAAAGWNIRELPLASSFASRVEGEHDLVVVPDTTLDIRFRTHPLVTAAPHVRFYAGVPLLDASGRFIGALSVLDRAARTPTTAQMNALRELGRTVMRTLTSRLPGAPAPAPASVPADGNQEITRLRELLEESEARFRDFFEQTDDFVISVAADGRLLHANEATFQVLGYTREELRGQLFTVIDPDAREAFRGALNDVFSSGESQRVETVFITSGGRRMTVEGFLRPRVIDGRAVMARVIFRDISDRKQFETDLASARDAALEAARLKTQFLTNVSHEIRTPMNGIVGMIDLLLATPLNPEQQECAHYARSSSEQLLSIVNNILYVSNVESGSLASANVDFDLFRTLQRIVEVMKIAALGKDLDVRFEFDPKLPLIIRGNQPRIRQAITNLMENAVKFTEEGFAELRVTLQTETDTHRVIRFEVKDSGIGISPEDRVMLFEKFSQVEAGSTRRFQGIGLGLATARQLVETMGGIIDVDSAVGKGSTFWFSVPFPKSAGARKPIVTSELEFKAKRVLLIDHLPTSRKIISHYLEQTWEMRVDHAETGAEALNLIRTAAAAGEPVRVVVFDALPDMDTAKFARQIREDKALASTSLVYLLATGGEGNVEQLRERGINSYVAKPVGQGELFDALTIALAQDAIPLAKSAIAKQGGAAAVEVTPEMRRGVRVLLAEDNFLNRKLTMSQLEKLGYTAESVGNGQEAIDAIATGRFDMVLMDCQMPVVDGYEATIAIRRMEAAAGKHHRIIAMTANALEGDREKCLAAGMDDYLSKPTNQEDLAKALSRFFA